MNAASQERSSNHTDDAQLWCNEQTGKRQKTGHIHDFPAIPFDLYTITSQFIKKILCHVFSLLLFFVSVGSILRIPVPEAVESDQADHNTENHSTA